MPQEVLLGCFGTYLDAYLDAYSTLDEQHAQFLRSAKLAPDAFLNSRQMLRYNEIEAAAIRVEIELLDGLFASLQHAAPADQSDHIRLARQVVELDVARSRLMSGPSDLGYWIRSGTGSGRGTRTGFAGNDGRASHAEYAADQRRIFLIRTTHIAERTATLRALASTIAAQRIVLAKETERLGVAGMSFSDAQTHVRPGPAGDVAMNALSDMYFLRAKQTMPAWVAFVRQQMSTYRALEGELTEAQRRKLLHEGWLSSLVSSERGGACLTLVTPNRYGETRFNPREIISTLLRLNGLTEDRKQAIREFGRTWIANDAALLHGEIAVALSTGAFANEESARGTCVSNGLAQLAEILTMPELTSGTPELSTTRFEGSLSDADAREFGSGALSAPLEARPLDSARSKERNERARAMPVGYSDDYGALLGRALGLSTSQQAVIDALVNDASARWDMDVALKVEAMRVKIGVKYNSTDQERRAVHDAWDRSWEKGTLAVAAAHSCDDALFASIHAALGTEANQEALKVVALARRIAEGSAWNPLASGQPTLANVARVALEANLTDSGRAVAFAAIAKSAEQWYALAETARTSRRLHWKFNQSGDLAMAQRADADPALVKAVEANRVQLEANIAAWTALQQDTEERALEGMSKEDAAQWRAALRRDRWPECFADTAPARDEVMRAIGPGPGTDSLRAHAEAAFEAAEPFLQRAGDAAVSICEDAARRPKRTDREFWLGNGADSRKRPLIELAYARIRVAQALARIRMPDEVAAKIPLDVPLDRLTAPALVTEDHR
jgi:hypothetical protein